MKQIAIDGPAGAGKSTIAKELSKSLGLMYVDTGAMYRTLALCCIREGVDLKCEAAVNECCEKADIDIVYEDGVQHMLLSGEDVSKEIRKEEVGKGASAVAVYAAVRKKLVAMQRALGERYDVVMDGRDIGTKVLPGADLKIYLTASAECRAKRRYDELKDRGESPDLSVIEQDIKMRDLNDMTRKESPLVKAEDAIEVDTSDMNIEQVTEEITKLFKEKIR